MGSESSLFPKSSMRCCKRAKCRSDFLGCSLTSAAFGFVAFRIPSSFAFAQINSSCFQYFMHAAILAFGAKENEAYRGYSSNAARTFSCIAGETPAVFAK